MPTKKANRLFDIATRLQVYIERVKNNEATEFNGVLRKLETEFAKLLNDVEYDSLDSLTKAKLNKLTLSLRKIQVKVYNDYSLKLTENLQEFMQASLTVNRIVYASVYQEEDQQESESLTDKEASKFIEQENEQLIAIPVFGIAAALIGSATLWPKLWNSPIAANGVLPSNFIKSFIASAQVALENIVRKGYANAWTSKQTIAEAKDMLRKTYSQADAVVSTVMQHVAANSGQAVTSTLWTKYRWCSVIDSGTTDICRSRNQKVYVFTKGPLPPAHIRCRSFIIPYDQAHDEETFYTWIKRQPPATQNAALGMKVASLMRNGKLSSKDVIKLSDAPAMSIAEFNKAADEILKGKKS